MRPTMELSGRHVVITGAASGIGLALARRFAAEGALLVVADLDADGVATVAKDVGGLGVSTDVSVEADVMALVAQATARHGPIDLFCSNAGIMVGGGPEATDEDWDRIWRINVMAHIYAARAVLPHMLERGQGYLLNTASAAGLLCDPGDFPYSVTKHAAVAVAEWLAITYGDAGIRVSCLCPQGVQTQMLAGLGDADRAFVQAAGGVLAPEDVADAVVAGLRDERFLILPHPEVAAYVAAKGADPERWLRGMRRLRARVTESLVPGSE